MKALTWKLVVPLTIVSFAVFRKWWYVFPVDAPDSMMAGFPFPYVCDGWFTSMSNQFFVLELTVDFLFYFLFWFLLILSINGYLLKIKVSKIITIFLFIICGIILSFAIFIASMRESVFKLKRDFEIEIKETGYNFIWENTERPRVEKYVEKKIE